MDFLIILFNSLELIPIQWCHLCLMTVVEDVQEAVATSEEEAVEIHLSVEEDKILVIINLTVVECEEAIMLSHNITKVKEIISTVVRILWVQW